MASFVFVFGEHRSTQVADHQCTELELAVFRHQSSLINAPPPRIISSSRVSLSSVFVPSCCLWCVVKQWLTRSSSSFARSAAVRPRNQLREERRHTPRKKRWKEESNRRHVSHIYIHSPSLPSSPSSSVPRRAPVSGRKGCVARARQRQGAVSPSSHTHSSCIATTRHSHRAAPALHATTRYQSRVEGEVRSALDEGASKHPSDVLDPRVSLLCPCAPVSSLAVASALARSDGSLLSGG